MTEVPELSGCMADGNTREEAIKNTEDVIHVWLASEEEDATGTIPIIRNGGITMPLAKERVYTIDDIEALPDGQRAELIDGEIYDMSTPTRTHQKISMELSTIINNYISSKKGKCEVYAAPFAVYLNQDDYNYFEPDITVVCDPSKLDDKGCHGAPDWVIEIVSPSSRSMDYFKKMFKYRTAGVREYWIVDPEKDSIIVYDFKGESGGNYTMSDVIPVDIFDGDLQIDFSTLNI